MIRKVLFVGLTLLAASAGTAHAGRWIHVRVKDHEDGQTVKVNFPLMSAAKLLALVDDDNLHDGHIRINDRDVDAVRLREIWSAVSEAGDGEFVTVEGEDENVKVSRSGGYMLVRVDDRSGHRHRSETVDIKIPVSVVDALLSGSNDELNLTAAIEALDAHGASDIVTVDDEDSHVRIWVDESQAGDNGGGR